VLLDPPLERLHVLLGLGPGRFQPGQLGPALGDRVFEGFASALFGLREDCLRLLLRPGEDARSLFAGLLHGHVRGPLG
jgi:hypothetical protein